MICSSLRKHVGEASGLDCYKPPVTTLCGLRCPTRALYGSHEHQVQALYERDGWRRIQSPSLRV